MTDPAPLSRRYRVVHRTTYRYTAEMVDGYTLAHLLARETPWQRVVDSTLDVVPDADERHVHIDLFGNLVVQLGMHRPHTDLDITCTSVVEVQVPSRPTLALTWEEAVAATAAVRGADALEVSPFVPSSPLVDVHAVAQAVQPFVSRSFRAGAGIVDAVAALCHEIHAEFVYDPTSTDVSTPLAAVLDTRRGVCQDFAHLAIACLRSIGLATRYVSGYLETIPPPGQPRLVGADASHAWFSVWIPGWGWLDVDPTNDQVLPDRHVTTAWGRDYGDVTPVRGVVIGPSTAQDLSVSVDVVEIP